jgi:hypothetical protein
MRISDPGITIQINRQWGCQFQDVMAEQLRLKGKKVQQNVRCSAGVIDIVADNWVVEIKSNLNRSELFKAIGQVLTYRDSYSISMQPVIIGVTRNIKRIAPIVYTVTKQSLFCPIGMWVYDTEWQIIPEDRIKELAMRDIKRWKSLDRLTEDEDWTC